MADPQPDDEAQLDEVAALALDRSDPPTIVAVAGSVAVGKTTVALQRAATIARLAPELAVR
ncbi:MAG: hypothetical protein ACYC2O_05070, partial [Microthrixaceae bacterium]